MCVIEDVDAVVGQRGEQFLAPAAVLLVDHPADRFVDGAQRFAGRLAIEAPLHDVAFHLLLEARHAHLEKFIEIRGSDGEKLYPFEQRIVGIERFIQHALVESKPAQFAAEKVSGQVGLHRGSEANGPFVPRKVTLLRRRWRRGVRFQWRRLFLRTPLPPHRAVCGFDVVGEASRVHERGRLHFGAQVRPQIGETREIVGQLDGGADIVLLGKRRQLGQTEVRELAETGPRNGRSADEAHHRHAHPEGIETGGVAEV